MVYRLTVIHMAVARLEKSYSRVTAKGQTTIPVGMRRALGIEPGDAVAFALQADRIVLTKAPRHDAGWLQALAGTLAEWDSDADSVYDDLGPV
ncbi:MAG: AbrB/MazE/SpoVT family DNA-binding domain-containing protein [Alphaproteobacteria bacterium]|nr:AbrB/MazE/SpoVT family DNA-binding domain-containing protein [Alphaproteobacteria bacterium]